MNTHAHEALLLHIRTRNRAGPRRTTCRPVPHPQELFPLVGRDQNDKRIPPPRSQSYFQNCLAPTFVLVGHKWENVLVRPIGYPFLGTGNYLTSPIRVSKVHVKTSCDCAGD
jgi:hypothetical protein